MASDIWLRTILIVRKETRCRHIGFSYRLTARVLLYAPSHRQDNTYHGLCYTSCGALLGSIAQWVHPMRDRSDDPRTMTERSTSELRPAPYTRKEESVVFNDELNTLSYGYMASDACIMSVRDYYSRTRNDDDYI